VTSAGTPFRVAIIGGGFIGQQNAVLFAKKGFRVTIIDIDQSVVNDLNSGITVVREEHFMRDWEKVRSRIEATTSYSPVSDADVVVISVNTPVKVYGDELVQLLSEGVSDINSFVDFKPLDFTAEKLASSVRKGAVISLESTIYPGGTRRHVIDVLSSAGFEIGRDIYVVHVPERVDPGNDRWTPETIPRVIGGDPSSLAKGIKLYEGMLGLKVHPVASLEVAEMSKIYENAYRLVNIAFAQEALMRSKIDFLELIEAVKTKPFGIQVFYPGPYAGGTCLVKDSLMYYSCTKSEIVRKALIINEITPKFYAEKIYEKLQRLGAKKVLVRGLGFKPNTPYYASDHLNPVMRVVNELRKLDSSITIHRYDPHITMHSDVSDINPDEYDIVLNWNYKDWLSFITS